MDRLKTLEIFQAVADKPRKNVMPATFQVAAALDEGLIEVYVPRAYAGDWKHFIDVVEHLYINGSPAEQIARVSSLLRAWLFAAVTKMMPASRAATIASRNASEL